MGANNILQILFVNNIFFSLKQSGTCSFGYRKVVFCFVLFLKGKGYIISEWKTCKRMIKRYLMELCP